MVKYHDHIGKHARLVLITVIQQLIFVASKNSCDTLKYQHKIKFHFVLHLLDGGSRNFKISYRFGLSARGYVVACSISRL